MLPLNQKVLIVTGAKGGLGTFVTNACLDAGATVIGVSRSIQNTDFTHSAFHGVPAELTSSDSVRPVVQFAIERFGRIDGLVHLLGAFAGGKPVADTDDDTFSQMIELNLRSAFLMMRAVLPHMREKGAGRIVAVGSRAAIEASAGAAAYSASKAALIALIRAVAAENADSSISANIVLPGTMDTPANRKGMPGADYGRWVQPAQVANLITALLSDQLGQVTGTAIPVYGREV
jgi:NAD(P)-dependent dehydrogenase (short-subunit alcohol dehydrogenase family)